MTCLPRKKPKDYRLLPDIPDYKNNYAANAYQLNTAFTSQVIALFTSQVIALFTSQVIALFTSRVIALFTWQPIK